MLRPPGPSFFMSMVFCETITPVWVLHRLSIWWYDCQFGMSQWRLQKSSHFSSIFRIHETSLFEATCINSGIPCKTWRNDCSIAPMPITPLHSMLLTFTGTTFPLPTYWILIHLMWSNFSETSSFFGSRPLSWGLLDRGCDMHSLLKCPVWPHW